VPALITVQRLFCPYVLDRNSIGRLPQYIAARKGASAIFGCAGRHVTLLRSGGLRPSRGPRNCTVTQAPQIRGAWRQNRRIERDGVAPGCSAIDSTGSPTGLRQKSRIASRIRGCAARGENRAGKSRVATVPSVPGSRLRGNWRHRGGQGLAALGPTGRRANRETCDGSVTWTRPDRPPLVQHVK